MDYPHIEIQAELENTTRSTVTLTYERGETSVTEADIIQAVRDCLGAAPEVAAVTATKHTVTQTAV